MDAGALRPLQEHARHRPRRDVDRGHRGVPDRGSADRQVRVAPDDAGRRHRRHARRQPRRARAAPAGAGPVPAGPGRVQRDDGHVDERPRRRRRAGARPADHVLAARRLVVRRRGRAGLAAGLVALGVHPRVTVAIASLLLLGLVLYFNTRLGEGSAAEGEERRGSACPRAASCCWRSSACSRWSPRARWATGAGSTCAATSARAPRSRPSRSPSSRPA